MNKRPGKMLSTAAMAAAGAARGCSTTVTTACVSEGAHTIHDEFTTKPSAAVRTTPARPAHARPFMRGSWVARVLLSVFSCSLLAAPAAVAQAVEQAVAQSRGELLYTTHCIACHTTAVHWRDKRSATTWAGLQAQVRHWQGVSALAWTDGDILAVSRYLNDSIYHFPLAAGPVSWWRRGGNPRMSTLSPLATHQQP